MSINVNDYLSCATDSEMIQAALDAAREYGEEVILPKHNRRTGRDLWEISKTVLLYDDSILTLVNAHLRMADGVICRMFQNSNSEAWERGEHPEIQRNITLRGIGRCVLDGGVHNGLYEVNGIARTFSAFPEHKTSENVTVWFYGAEFVTVENLTFKNHRYWACLLHHVAYSRVSNVRLESDSNVPNQDGVDLSKGCHDVIIENITGCTGDNIVALNLLGYEPDGTIGGREGDTHDVTIRNVICHGVGGCALIRLLNHDGYRLYNIHIDNVMETSPWSPQDSSVAPNPDLNLRSNDRGEIVRLRQLTPGEEGYRCEAAILIGESYWFAKSKAQPGDTYGISVSNVSTHARFAVWLNNTVQNSSFKNIRLLGNGFMAVYFGEGVMENLHFSGIYYDSDCRPLACDEVIDIPWNNTHSEGFSCVYLHGTALKNVWFSDMHCAAGFRSVVGGSGSGSIHFIGLNKGTIPALNEAAGLLTDLQ